MSGHELIKINPHFNVLGTREAADDLLPNTGRAIDSCKIRLCDKMNCITHIWVLTNPSLKRCANRFPDELNLHPLCAAGWQLPQRFWDSIDSYAGDNTKEVLVAKWNADEAADLGDPVRAPINNC